MNIHISKQIIFFIITILLVTVTIGCRQDDDNNESQLSLIKTTNPSPIVVEKGAIDQQSEALKIKKIIRSSSEIYDVAVVKSDKRVLVAYKVKHLQRFRMKKIEKQVKEQLKQYFPKEKFIVSSDYKIFLEAVRLNEKIENNDYNEKQVRKQFNYIVKLTKEQT